MKIFFEKGGTKIDTSEKQRRMKKFGIGVHLATVSGKRGGISVIFPTITFRALSIGRQGRREVKIFVLRPIAVRFFYSCPYCVFFL